MPENADSTFDNAFMTGEQSYKYYNEFYDPVYKGIGQIIRWFEDWNRKGTVLQWAIKRVIVSGNTAVEEQYFKCDYEGNVDGFDGVTIAEVDVDIKICDLNEFQSKVEHYCPCDF